MNESKEQGSTKNDQALIGQVEPLVIRESLKRFAEKMELKLQKNDHKGGWSECEDGYLLHRITGELRELQDAMLDGNHKRVIDEATDVANFAMMIADNYGKNI